MNRRRFIVSSVTSVSLLGGLAGCLGGLLGGSATPPPRRSTVFQDVAIENRTLRIDLAEDPRVESRADLGTDSLAPAALLPVGRAAAKGKGGGGGRGATGRGSGGWGTAPHRNGRAVYHGGDYDDWREDHDDDVSRYHATVTRLGIARLGSLLLDEDDLPGAGPADSWDETIDPSGQSDPMTYRVDRTGWYRVGARLEAERYDRDFNWAAIDFQVDDRNDGYQVENPWKVSPRL
jgi:hypothetical protein